jgi:hypothetical protein
MSQTLASVIGSTESEGSDPSEYKLNPGHDRQCLSYYTMCLDHNPPNLAMYSFLKVELEVDTHDDLDDQHEHDDRDESGVDVLGELSALMFMA